MSKPAPNPSDAKVTSTGPLARAVRKNCIATFSICGSLMCRNSKSYNDPLGKERTWESAERSTRPAASEIDGVGIIAILSKSSGPEIVLQKQFRPPINKVVIEIPAGLVDAGESAAESAVRELKEETGYVGTLAEDVGVVMFNDPGFCNTNLNLVHVTVDMSLPANQAPKPQLEESEFIEVFSTPLRELYDQCKHWEREGYAIDARVGTLAEGIEVARRWKL